MSFAFIKSVMLKKWAGSLFLLTVHEDFTWAGFYVSKRNSRSRSLQFNEKPAISNELRYICFNYWTSIHVCCMFIVSKVIQLVSTLSTCEICEGNPDEKFLTLPNIHKNCLKNISSKFNNSMSKCCILCIASIVGSAKCNVALSF